HTHPRKDGADAGAVGVLTFTNDDGQKFHARVYPGPHPEEEEWRKRDQEMADGMRQQQYVECTFDPALSEDEASKQYDEWLKKPWEERKAIVDAFTKEHPFWEQECKARFDALDRLKKWLEEAGTVETTEQSIKRIEEAEDRVLKKHGII